MLKHIRLFKIEVGGRRLYLPRKPSIKIIDFGNVVGEGDSRTDTVNTRQYRAPEVILSLLIRIL